MADLLIRNMKIPKTCQDCMIEQHEEDWYGDEFSHECAFIYKGYTRECRRDGRLKECPLIEVPSHGDLIDKKELAKELQLMYENALNWFLKAEDAEDGAYARGVVRALIDCAYFLDRARVIIPASKEE